jgi:SAM-dependent methyltransferase
MGQAQKTGEAVWHDIECGAYTADLPLWRGLAEAASRRTGKACRLLELGCGTGRVSLALAGPDCQVTALDNEPALVEEMEFRARAADVPVTTVVADARSFELSSRFDIVIAPMQIVQLLRPRDRQDMLVCVADHLDPDGRSAVALLDPDDDWEATAEASPPPDMREEDGWVYSSHPIAVRRTDRGAAIELDRIRRAVSPVGELEESFSRVRLELVSPAAIERAGRRAGLVPEQRLTVPPTDDHAGSTVVVLRSEVSDRERAASG